jgi:hypothetical protein
MRKFDWMTLAIAAPDDCGVLLADAFHDGRRGTADGGTGIFEERRTRAIDRRRGTQGPRPGNLVRNSTA